MGYSQGRQSLPHLFHGPGHRALGTPVSGGVGGLPLQSTLRARNPREPPEPSAWPEPLAPPVPPSTPITPISLAHATAHTWSSPFAVH